MHSHDHQLENDWANVEKDTGLSIRDMAKDYLFETDSKSLFYSIPTLYNFAKFVATKMPTATTIPSSLFFGAPKSFSSDHGIVIFPLKDYKALRNEMGASSNSNPNVLETIDHLMDKAEYMRSLGKISVMHDIDAIFKTYGTGSEEIYDLPPLPDPTNQEQDSFVKSALLELALEHPAVTARLFNEASIRAGFSKHVKRNEVMDLIEELLTK